MVVGPHRCSLDFLLLIGSAVLLWDPVYLSDSLSPAPPAPSLTQQNPQGGGTVDLLCQAPEGHSGVLFRLYRVRELVAQVDFQQEEREAHFYLRAEVGVSQDLYCCMYQDRHRRPSRYSLYMRPSELLPQPTLSLLDPDPGDEGVTVQCMGPQAYPGAHFTLLRLGSSFPVTSRLAGPARHTVYFTLSAYQPDPEQYQCQYSVLIGQQWRESERSLPLTVHSLIGTNFITAEVSPPSTPPPSSGAPDWPLIAGCVSAALLFLVVLAGLGIAVQRRVKALAEKKKRREEDRFWKHLHSMDHTLATAMKFHEDLNAYEKNRTRTGPNLEAHQHWLPGMGPQFHSPSQNILPDGPSMPSLYV